ncbi:Uncharacterised protein [Mycobacteroides abscessus subsp. abscessus]|nr:Uncharacterised protein [Mycobacteroides abscessus subsp. abscessus]
MIFQPGPDDLLSIVKVFRPNEPHDGIDQERLHLTRDRVGTGLQSLLIHRDTANP